jgi:uncharacterized protein (TIGR03437 family)
MVVTLNPAGLVPGTYSASLSFTSSDGSAQIPVSLTVTPAATLVSQPTAVGLAGTYGSTTQTTQSVQLTSTNASVPFTASSNAPWLTFAASGATTPATLQISADPSGLPAATYQANITVAVPGATNSPYAIPVRFVVGGTGAPGQSGVDNSASFTAATVAPNTILALFGPALGCTPNPQVLVNGSPASVLFAGSSQINFVVPDGVGSSSGSSSASIQVVCGGNAVETVVLPLAPTDPSVFTQAGNGAGQGSILNADGTVNAPGNPASRGSYISVYVTGFGPFNAASPDGLQRLTDPVTATIGGVGVTVLYAGEAPTETSGLQQINLQLPAGLTVGTNLPIVLTSNGIATQAGVTVAIQ